MTLDSFFGLSQRKTTARREVLAGVSTFLTMSYIVFVNPMIVGDTGIPHAGLFAGTILAAAASTLLMSLFANAPFAIASGMGINTFVTYTVCLGMGFLWQEALGLVFLAGLIQFSLTATRFRKEVVRAIPSHIKYATTAAIGLLILYIGTKNAGLISYTFNPGQYFVGGKGIVTGNSQTVQEMVGIFSKEQFLAVFGLLLTISLLTLERRTGDNYGAFITSVLTVTFLGIPLGITKIQVFKLFDLTPLSDLGGEILSFWGDPGLLSLMADPKKLAPGLLIVLILTITGIVDSVSSIVGIGTLEYAPVFSEQDIKDFSKKPGVSSKLDRALIADSAGGLIASFFGTTSNTCFAESTTGIAAGGRTGLTSLVVALLFLLCLPFSSFFAIVPEAAPAPVLMIAGVYLMSLLKKVNWTDFEEAVPSGLILALIPFTYSIINGVCAGYISHIVIKVMKGEARQVHPIIYVIAFLFIGSIVFRTSYGI